MEKLASSSDGGELPRRTSTTWTGLPVSDTAVRTTRLGGRDILNVSIDRSADLTGNDVITSEHGPTEPRTGLSCVSPVVSVSVGNDEVEDGRGFNRETF